MREINVSAVVDAVAQACMTANYELPEDVAKALEEGLAKEESPIGKDIFGQLIENAKIAREESVAICQDTGFTVVFVEIGQDVHMTGGSLTDAINEGVRRGYSEGFLRKSIVAHPLERINTGDNTPAIIHTTIVPGDKLHIIIAPKGGGSENIALLRC